MSQLLGKKKTTWSQVARSAMAAGLLLSSMTLTAQPAWASDAQDARQLVEKAQLTFDSFRADPQMGPSFGALIHRAKGVLIFPQVLRGAFLFGGAGGSGVFLARNEKDNSWAGPAFYTIGEASLGLQAGADASEVILVALTDRGVDALLTTSAKLGAQASVAVGPVGAGAEAATANLSADLVSYSRHQGLYAGLSAEGAVVSPRNALDRAYYGRPVTPEQILVRREVENPQADGLIGAVSRVAGSRPVSTSGTTPPRRTS